MVVTHKSKRTNVASIGMKTKYPVFTFFSSRWSQSWFALRALQSPPLHVRTDIASFVREMMEKSIWKNSKHSIFTEQSIFVFTHSGYEKYFTEKSYLYTNIAIVFASTQQCQFSRRAKIWKCRRKANMIPMRSCLVSKWAAAFPLFSPHFAKSKSAIKSLLGALKE